MKCGRNVGLLLVLAAFAASIVGCGAPREPRVAQLVGTEWTLTSLKSEDLIEGSVITLRFEEEYLAGHMGCNGYGGGRDSGAYATADDGTLKVSYPLAVTVQLCSEPEGIMEQEAAYISTLLTVAEYQVSGSRLELMGAAGDTVLVFARHE